MGDMEFTAKAVDDLLNPYIQALRLQWPDGGVVILSIYGSGGAEALIEDRPMLEKVASEAREILDGRRHG